MLPLDARAAAIGDFLESHFPIRLYPDGARNLLDCEGRGRRVRIAAVRNHASTNELVRQVKQAALSTPKRQRAIELIRTAKPMSRPRPALCCWTFRRSSPEHACWTTL